MAPCSRKCLIKGRVVAMQIVDKRREAAAKMKQRMQQASNGALSPGASRQAPESMRDGHLPLKNKKIVKPGLENTGSRVEEDSFQYKMKASVFFDAERGVVFQGQARPSPVCIRMYTHWHAQSFCL